MKKNVKKSLVLIVAALFGLTAAGYLFSQGFQRPETIIPEKIIKAVLNEVSGQLAFNNEVMMSGYNHIRPDEEFETYFYEAKYLTKKLKEYGIDEVVLEDLGEKTGRGGWWARQDAELWMVAPEERRLSRLEEHPALMARLTDSGEWEGELVYVDMRDQRRLKDMDFTGKIVLTPMHPGRCVPALQKGALGIISCKTPKAYSDPYSVMFDMRFNKGGIKRPSFAFYIWRKLMEELRDMIFEGQKVVLRATAATKNMPWKLDTVLATIKGTQPEKKGFMFTAHLFERPVKQGANDNISGCVVLAEIARTLTRMIEEGRIERPERSIYFLMGEEGGSTMAFFNKHPDMRDKIFGVINMDMVGENLEENSAFFSIERSIFSKPTFIDSAAINAARYVFETNIERHSNRSQKDYVDFPVPIVEKNGTKQPFRFLTREHGGASDHGIFIDTDSGIPALSFNCWPDLWYHTDRDRPDKSDPTQLKRVAFIGILSALSFCSGDNAILENLIRFSYQEKRELIQNVVNKAIEKVSKLREGDGGKTFSHARNDIIQAVKVYQAALSGIGELTQGKAVLSAYLSRTIQGLDSLGKDSLVQLKEYYKSIAALRGFKPEIAKMTSEEKKLEKIIPAKVAPLALGSRFPFREVTGAIRKDEQLAPKMWVHYSYPHFKEMYLSIDGKRTMADIRNLVSFAFAPVPVDDFVRMMNCFKKAGLITY